MHVWLFFGNFGDRPFRSRPSRSSSVLPRGRRTGATGPTWPTAPRTLWRAVRREGRREGSNSDEDLWHDWTMPPRPHSAPHRTAANQMRNTTYTQPDY